MLLDPENQDDFVWVDTACSGEYFDGLLRLVGFESCIHKRAHETTRLVKQPKNTITSSRRLELVLNIYLAALRPQWAASSLETLALSGIRLGGGLQI